MPRFRAGYRCAIAGPLTCNLNSSFFFPPPPLPSTRHPFRSSRFAKAFGTYYLHPIGITDFLPWNPFGVRSQRAHTSGFRSRVFDSKTFFHREEGGGGGGGGRKKTTSILVPVTNSTATVKRVVPRFGNARKETEKREKASTVLPPPSPSPPPPAAIDRLRFTLTQRIVISARSPQCTFLFLFAVVDYFRARGERT